MPVYREMDGETLVQGIRPDGTLIVTFDGLRIPVALPPLASAILPLIDGQRNVGQIARGAGGAGDQGGGVWKAWRQTFAALERVNRVAAGGAAGGLMGDARGRRGQCLLEISSTRTWTAFN